MNTGNSSGESSEEGTPASADAPSPSAGSPGSEAAPAANPDPQPPPPDSRKEAGPAWLGSDVPTIDQSHSELSSTRRDFLTKVGLALGGLSGLIVVGPVIGFLVAPLFRKPPEIWRSVGPTSNFKVGETVEVTFEEASPLPWSGTTAKTAAWLRRNTAVDFTAYSVQCTHLGCPVSWLPGAKLFMCPCHGGVYYPDGRVAAGPPPDPLPEYPVRVREGQVELMVSAVPRSPKVQD
ncbi:MAG: ubiquinol-cytochrome c reductase iron-sulfur subunit [Chloroflexia bacterium]